MSALDSLGEISARHPDLGVAVAPGTRATGNLTVVISGSLDNTNGHSFAKAFEAVIRESEGLASIRLVAPELKYISSTGAGALVTIAMAASAKGIDFSLSNPCKKVMMVLSVLGFDKFLCVESAEARE